MVATVTLTSLLRFTHAFYCSFVTSLEDVRGSTSKKYGVIVSECTDATIWRERGSSLLQSRRHPWVEHGPEHTQRVRTWACRCAAWYTGRKGQTGGGRRLPRKVADDADTALPLSSREQREGPWAWRAAANKPAADGGREQWWQARDRWTRQWRRIFHMQW